MKIAFVFAHSDDESLSSGGTIARYVRTGHEVITVCLSSSPTRKEEYLSAVKTLGIIEPIAYDYENVADNETEITKKLISFILEFSLQFRYSPLFFLVLGYGIE